MSMPQRLKLDPNVEPLDIDVFGRALGFIPR